MARISPVREAARKAVGSGFDPPPASRAARSTRDVRLPPKQMVASSNLAEPTGCSAVRWSLGVSQGSDHMPEVARAGRATVELGATADHLYRGVGAQRLLQLSFPFGSLYPQHPPNGLAHSAERDGEPLWLRAVAARSGIGRGARPWRPRSA
jgi:hypothetical protein